MNPKRYPLSAMMLLVVFVTHFSALHQTCSACDLATETSCQAYDGFGESAVSDWSFGSFVADDFIPLSDTITSLCVWGKYVDNQLQPAPQCVDQVQDRFSVEIYSTNVSDDLPQWRIRWAHATVTRIQVSGSDDFEYQLVLDEPFTGLLLDGRKYWIEVTNALFDYPDCNWSWSRINPQNPGNQFSLQDVWSDYGVLSPRGVDQSFCLDIDFTHPVTPIKPCCTCIDGICAMTTVEDCHAVDGQWHIDATSCNSISCTAGVPTNNSCTTPVDVTNLGGAYTNNYCATTDGYNPVQTENGLENLEYDLWYTFTNIYGCGTILSVSTCNTAQSYDSMIAVYTNNTAECPCPNDEDTHQVTFVGGANDNCSNKFSVNNGFIYIDMRSDVCYTIRVGGSTNGDARGLGILNAGITFIDFFTTPAYPDPEVPGAYGCLYGNQEGAPCMTCNGGSRAGELCMDDNDCAGNACVKDDSICGGGYCGIDPVYPDEQNVMVSWPKDRFISIQTDQYWWATGMRVKLDNIKDHPECNGQYRWAGPPIEYCEDVFCETKFYASLLQSEPYFTDWTPYSAVQIYGEEIISDSFYSIQVLEDYYIDQVDDELCYTYPTYFQTGKWGDVVAPFHGFTSSSQPTIADVLAIVDKWLGALEPRKPRTQLQPQIPNPNLGVGIADVLQAVDAWLGSPYPYPIDSCSP